MIDFRKLSLHKHLLIAEQIAISASTVLREWGRTKFDPQQLEAVLSITNIIRHQLNNQHGDDTLYDLAHTFQVEGIKALKQTHNLSINADKSFDSVDPRTLPDPNVAYAARALLSVFAAADTIGWALDYENGDEQAVQVAAKNSTEDLSDAVQDLAQARSVSVDILCEELLLSVEK